MGVSRPKAEQQQHPRADTASPHYRVAETLSRATVERAVKEAAKIKGSGPPNIDFLVWHSCYSERSSEFAALLSALVDRGTVHWL